MPDWGTILQVAGQVVKIGGTIGGSIAARKAERRMRHRNDKLLKDMRTREQENFENQYYADATATGDNQRSLTMMQDYLRNRRAELSGMQALGMSTGESMAAQKAADNEAVAATHSTIAANADAKKDTLRANHLAAQEGYDQTQMALNKDHFSNRMQNISNGVKISNDTGDSLIEAGTAMGGKAQFKTGTKTS